MAFDILSTASELSSRNTKEKLLLRRTPPDPTTNERARKLDLGSRTAIRDVNYAYIHYTFYSETPGKQ